MNIERLKKRLCRLELRHKELKQIHAGNESDLTYYAGYNLGYLEGQIRELEDIVVEDV